MLESLSVKFQAATMNKTEICFCMKVLKDCDIYFLENSFFVELFFKISML